MTNFSFVSKVYAKALFELSLEDVQGKKIGDLEKELILINEAISAHNTLENVLFLEIFSVQEKQEVLKDLCLLLGVSQFSQNFVQFLATQKRLNLFPLIVKDLVVLKDSSLGFLKGTIEGEEEVISSDLLALVQKYLCDVVSQIEKNQNNIYNIQLEYKKNEHILQGYKVRLSDLLLDCTLDHQLNKFKHTSF